MARRPAPTPATVALLLVYLALTASTAAAASVGGFSELNQITPLPEAGNNAGLRLGSAVGPMNDGSLLYIGGQAGYNPVIYTNSIFRSTDNGQSWTEVAVTSSVFSVRRTLTSSRLSDDSIVVVGGWAGSFNYRQDAWRSTDMGETWTKMTDGGDGNLPFISGHAAVVLADDSIVVMGGHQATTASAAAVSDDVWKSTDQGATWTLVSSGPHWAPSRFLDAQVLSNGDIVVANGENFKGEAWKSTNDGAGWSQLNGGGLSSTSAGVMLVLSDDTLVYVGGGNTEDVYISTDGGGSWTINAGGSLDSPGTDHDDASGLVVGSDILIIGGRYTNVIAYYTNSIWTAPISGLPTCDATCATCADTASGACTSCGSGFFVNAAGNDFAGTCDAHATCSSSQYESSAPTGRTDRECTSCDSTCLTCSGSATSCDSCAAGKWLTGASSCSSCDGSCATCDGGTSTDCLSCTGATFLNAGAGSCDSHVVTCLSSQYEVSAPDNTADRVCASCDSSCATCSGPASTDCASCATGSVDESNQCPSSNCPTSTPNLYKVQHGGTDYLASTDCAATGHTCTILTPRTVDDLGVTYYLVSAFPTDGTMGTCV